MYRSCPERRDTHSDIDIICPSEPLRECPGCDAEIEPGARVYEIEGESFCEDCFKDWVRDYVDSNPEDVAKALRVDVSMAREQQNCFSIYP